MHDEKIDLEIAKSNKDQYNRHGPLSHIFFDNIFNESILNNILNDFPNNLEKIGKL